MPGDEVAQDCADLASAVEAPLPDCDRDAVDHYESNLSFTARGAQQVICKCCRLDFRQVLMFGNRLDLAHFETAHCDAIFHRDHRSPQTYIPTRLQITRAGQLVFTLHFGVPLHACIC